MTSYSSYSSGDPRSSNRQECPYCHSVRMNSREAMPTSTTKYSMTRDLDEIYGFSHLPSQTKYSMTKNVHEDMERAHKLQYIKNDDDDYDIFLGIHNPPSICSEKERKRHTIWNATIKVTADSVFDPINGDEILSMTVEVTGKMDGKLITKLFTNKKAYSSTGSESIQEDMPEEAARALYEYWKDGIENNVIWIFSILYEATCNLQKNPKILAIRIDGITDSEGNFSPDGATLWSGE